MQNTQTNNNHDTEELKVISSSSTSNGEPSASASSVANVINPTVSPSCSVSNSSDEPIINSATSNCHKNDQNKDDEAVISSTSTPSLSVRDDKDSSSSTSTTTLSVSERAKMESFTFFKPKIVLLLFTLINFVIYFDRGVVAPAVTYIRVDKDIIGGEDKPALTQEQSGALYSSFMVGFFIFNPIFVALSSWVPSNKIILCGIFSWCVAVVLAGAAADYNLLLVTRCLTGIGEAAFVPFSVTVIDNIAPKTERSYWLSIFYATIPFGNALGILISGIVSSATWFGGSIAGWRMQFYLESLPMVVLFGVCVFLPREFNVQREHRHVDDNTENNNSNDHETNQSNNNNANKLTLLDALRMLILENKYYVIASLGCTAYTFVLGALSFFAVSMLVQSNFNVSVVQASLLLGVTTSVMGIVGSVAGGKIVDSMDGGSIGNKGNYNSAWMMTMCLIASIPLGYLALLSTDFVFFCVYFVATVFFVFLLTAPMSGMILSIVKPELRTYAIAVNTLAIHLLGDSFSPGLTGKLADHFDGGCSLFDENRTVCESHVITTSSSTADDDSSSERCKFLESHSINEKSSCVNPEELFKAMRIIWLMFFVALPMWGYLMIKFKKKISDGK